MRNDTMGFIKSFTDTSILMLLDHEIKEYSEMSKNEKFNEEDREGYKQTACVLEGFQRKVTRNWIIHSENAVMSILQENYEKYDTEFISVNNEIVYTVNKDNPFISVEDNYLLIHEETEDKTIVPPVKKAINLDNIIKIRTLKEA